MPKRNPFLVIGLLAVLVGVVLLFVPGDPAADPEEPLFAAYWWLATPFILIGIVLLAIGRRRYRMTRRPARDEG